MSILETIVQEYVCTLLGKSKGHGDKLIEALQEETNSRRQRDFIVASSLVINNYPDRIELLKDLYQPRAFFMELLDNTSFALDNETLDTFLLEDTIPKKVNATGMLEYKVHSVLNVMKVFYENSYLFKYSNNK